MSKISLVDGMGYGLVRALNDEHEALGLLLRTTKERKRKKKARTLSVRPSLAFK